MESVPFAVSEEACAWLSRRDTRLGAMITRIGPLERMVIPDLFTALVHSVIGQQISGKAHRSIWQRFITLCGVVEPTRLLALSEPSLRECGLSGRKVSYIREAARRIVSGELDLSALTRMEDQAFVQSLCTLPGVGPWTAEMLLIFSLCRPNVLSAGDLGIQRGIRMLYGKKNVTPSFLLTLKKRYAPFATTASFYLWEIAGRAWDDLVDPIAKRSR